MSENAYDLLVLGGCLASLILVAWGWIAWCKPKGYIWIRDPKESRVLWPDPMHQIWYVDLFWVKTQEAGVIKQEVEINGRTLKIDLRPHWQNGRRYYKVVLELSGVERSFSIDPRLRGPQVLNIEYLATRCQFVYQRQRPR